MLHGRLFQPPETHHQLRSQGVLTVCKSQNSSTAVNGLGHSLLYEVHVLYMGKFLETEMSIGAFWHTHRSRKTSGVKTLKSNIRNTNFQVNPLTFLHFTGFFRTCKYRSVIGLSNNSQSDETWMNLRPRIDVRRLSCSINMLSASWVTLALPNIDDTVRPSASRSCIHTNWLVTARVSIY